ncbi:MAG: hypothetical protein RIQ93_485 [Verrucomicrobiota bacterium]|jgi:hypothetical protein
MTPRIISLMRNPGISLWRNRIPLAGWTGVVVFALLALRFWHPYYGFTKFIQIDEADGAVAVRELRERPVYLHPGENGYDAAAYVQIAYHPLLNSEELAPAIRNVPYRARRILGSALAWVLSLGDADYIAQVYAALNLGVWLALAWITWRLLAVHDWRGWVGWSGFMFSAGALHAVRLALTDLLAVTLLGAALLLLERHRSKLAMAALAAAGLARETGVACLVIFLRGPWKSSRTWWRLVPRVAIVAAPLASWMLYVRWKAGAGDQGFGNFSWPVLAFVEKWGATWSDFGQHPDFRWLIISTFLATAALGAQALYLLLHQRGEDACWRAGIAGVALMAFLGGAVWEGHPGAATRVLLPMSLAFAVCAVRYRAGMGWLLAGALSVMSGILALWHVPHHPREIAAGRFAGGAFVARSLEGWYPTERNARRVWAWSSGNATLALDLWPRSAGLRAVVVDLRAIAPQRLEIRQGGRMLWQGTIGTARQKIALEGAHADDGKLRLDLVSLDPPVAENSSAGARALSFAVDGVSLR